MKRFVSLLLALALLIPAMAAGAETAQAPSFADFGNLEWMFSSGVGAWYTCMWIEEDGSFTGSFHDSEMGDAADAYPYGTVYGCLFHGKMRMGEQVDDYTWKVLVEEVALDEGQVPQAIEDGIRFVTTDPYGVKAGQEMLLYLPGTPVESLNEDFLFWAHIFDESVTVLPSYGLYDPQEQTGFIAEPVDPLDAAILGAWRSAEDGAGNAYARLDLSIDGTGLSSWAPDEAGVPLSWFPDGAGWTVYFGSPDNAGFLTYDLENDELILTEQPENADARQTVYIRDWTVEEDE